MSISLYPSRHKRNDPKDSSYSQYPISPDRTLNTIVLKIASIHTMISSVYKFFLLGPLFEIHLANPYKFPFLSPR
jgi:hypothetical protein